MLRKVILPLEGLATIVTLKETLLVGLVAAGVGHGSRNIFNHHHKVGVSDIVFGGIIFR